MSDSARRLVLVDDDAVFAAVMSRALKSRGFTVSIAPDAAAALSLVRIQTPQFAVIDLKLGADSGLALISSLLELMPLLRILLLTGYASIATAVEAIKRGAHDYLAKPVDADAVVKALLTDTTLHISEIANETAPPLKRLEWEHIQRVLNEYGGNISETARRLGLHRRTLQRKLMKRPIRERLS